MINTEYVEKFKFYANKIIPLVYDESLSYYEFLCKVLQKLNEVIDSVNNENDILKDFDDNISEWETRTDEKYNAFVTQVQDDINEISNLLSNMTVYAETLPAGSSAAASISIVDDHFVLELDIPKGDKGDQGDVNTAQMNAAIAAGVAEEAAARTAADDVLDARIDAIIALPEGSTTGDAELMDIRIGANGITYPTAGDAVRDQVSDLNSALSKVKGISEKNIETVNVSNYYYATIQPLSPLKKYSIYVTIETSGTYTIQTSVRTSESTIVDTLASNLNVTANVPVKFFDYVPTEEVARVRINSNSVNWSVTIKEVLGADDIYQNKTDIQENTLDISQNTADISALQNIIGNIEIDKYGIKWLVSDNDDLGTRCFNAVGKTATIGVGSTDGASDFDTIYPWSEMKRCNILKNVNGAELIVFEGETGFALDGSNGDVFVRIPKFRYESYIEDGYEYRVISKNIGEVHPAFIEDGIEVDAIYIGAYEAYADNSKLCSLKGVIPTSNITAGTFLTYARNKGANYSLYDSRCVDAVWLLMTIEFGCRNTNQIIGYGMANFQQPSNNGRCNIILQSPNTNTVRTTIFSSAYKNYMPIGSNITVCKSTQQNILTQAKLLSVVDGADYTDWTFDGDAINVDTDCFIGSAACTTGFCSDAPTGALSWHTGRANWISNNKQRNPVRYRWIENLVGSLWQFLPDITFNDLQMYICKNMKDYEFGKITSPYYPIGALLPINSDLGNIPVDETGTNKWVVKLINDYFDKNIPFGKTYSDEINSTKAFGAYYYLKNGNRIVTNGGGFDHMYRCNVLTNRAWVDTTSYWYLYGARLMYKHIN